MFSRAALLALFAAPALAGAAFTLEDLLIRTKRPVVREMEATGYCSCPKCCPRAARTNEQGVVKRPAPAGITASGTPARLGTVAADTSVLPLGTLVYVDGFGWGRVEDRGSAIRGNRLDLWFDDHAKARRWGRRKVPVKIWLLSEAR